MFLFFFSLSSDSCEETLVALKKNPHCSGPAEETVLSLDKDGFVTEGLCRCGATWYVHAVVLLSRQAALAMHVLAACSNKDKQFGRALRYVETAILCYGKSH